MDILFQGFVLSLLIGTLIAFSVGSRSRSKKKKSYRRGQFFGYGKEIDKKIYKENKNLLDDNIEYHASQKFK